MNFIDACRRFVAIDSSLDHGTVEMTRYAKSLCETLGMCVQVQEELYKGRLENNIIARWHPEVPKSEFMLQAHLDTPDPGIYSLWTKTGSNPFSASIYGDCLYGLGAANIKLDFLCKLEAMRRLGKQIFKRPPVLVGTFGAERGMAGAVKLLRRSKVNATHCLVGHPTGLRLVSASSGLAVVEVVLPFSDEEIVYHKKHDLALSSSCQSKMFYKDDGVEVPDSLESNAIVKLISYLKQLPEGIAILDVEGGTHYNSEPESAVLELDIMGGFQAETVAVKLTRLLEKIRLVESDFKNYPSEGFYPKVPTLNIGSIRKRKDHILLSGCCRLTPAVTTEAYEKWISLLTEACWSLGGNFRVVDLKPPLKDCTDAEFVGACQRSAKALSLSTDLTKSSICTEASVFSRLGLECLVFGPGNLGEGPIGPDEKVSLIELSQAVDFYENVLKEFCVN